MDLQPAAGLPAAGAYPSPAAQVDGHDHPLDGEADVDDRCPAQTEQPLECGGGTHVVLLGEPLAFDSQQPAAEDGGAPAKPAHHPQRR
jgi:hypothetical protein